MSMGDLKRCLHVGVLVNNITGYFNRELIDSLCKKARVEGIKLFLISGRHLNDPVLVERQFNLSYAFGNSPHLDAIICASAYVHGDVPVEELFRFVQRYSHLPTISLNYAIPGCTSVVIDNAVGFKALLHHLIYDHGYTRLAFMKGPEGTPDADTLFDIYVSCLEQAGLVYDPRLVVQGRFTHTDGRSAMAQLLDCNLPFDVLVCANDGMAQAAVTIAVERGFRIPQDFAVTGFDDILSISHTGLPLTTVNQPIHLLAESAIDALLAHFSGEPIGAVISLPTRVVIRLSCGCVTKIHTTEVAAKLNHHQCDRHEQLITNLRLLPEQESQFLDFLRQLETSLEQGADIFEDCLSRIAYVCLEKFGDISRLQSLLLSMYRALLDMPDTSTERLRNSGEILLRSQIILFNAQSVFYSSEKSLEDASDYLYREINFLKRNMSGFKTDHILDLIELAMHEFRIPSAYIVLYSAPIVFDSIENFTLPENSRLVFGVTDYVRQTERVNVLFNTLNIVPDQLFVERDHQVLALFPIFQHSDHYGYMLLDLTVMPTCRLETLRDEISNTLINCLLLAELEQTLKRNVVMQDELVQIEKMAALGRLVAGMAHELNTPIGNALLGATSLRERIQNFGETVRNGSVKRTELVQFETTSVSASLLVERNLNRASELITNFKMVAVDQTAEHRRDCDLGDTISQVMATLNNLIRHRPIQLHLNIMHGISMNSYPGPIGQLISNFFTNALTHAFAIDAPGDIWISCQTKDEDTAIISFRDNGSGVPSEHLNKIFDPFFTTRMGLGGSGLGLSIVRNIATGILGGKLEVQSTLGQGTTFTVSIPRIAPIH
jgi:signal transduction histidine kinase/DNA-binding LacI/PurR family transcriptional regulator